MAAFDFSSSFSGINSALQNIGKQNERAWQMKALGEIGKDIDTGNLSVAAQKLFGLGEFGPATKLLELGQAAKDREADAGLLRGLPGLGSASPTPVTPAAAIGNPNEIENRFVNTVKGAGLTNPVGLGAVAAYGKAESGFSPQNVNRSWNDPSESGQPGTAGGIMSWRAERLQNLQRFAQQRGEQQPSVETQALFLAQEDPTLIPKLQAARTPQEANQIMANAWRFAGYNREGGENARRLALTQQYAQRYGGQGSPAPAIPVQVAENEADVQRLEAQQGNPIVDAPAAAPVQVAQAPAQPGAPVADVPAPGAAPAQGFAIPGTDVVVPQSLMDDQRVRTLSGALLQARTEKARTAIKGQLDLAVKDVERRMARENVRVRPLTDPAERAARGIPATDTAPYQIDANGRVTAVGGNRTTVNVKNEGTIPAGYRAVRDADGNVERLEAIPGSEAAKKEEVAQSKVERERRMRIETGNTVANALDDIDLLMKNATLPVAGPLGSRFAAVPGTAAHDVSKALETVGANISFQQLSEMRQASPTGGALGAVTERELELLKNSYASLSQSQSEGQFRANLGRVRATFERIVHGKTLTPQERRAGGPMTLERARGLRDEAAQAIANGAPRDEVVKRLKEQYGITPEGL